jgi:hypothetical protein
VVAAVAVAEAVVVPGAAAPQAVAAVRRVQQAVAQRAPLDQRARPGR